MLPTEPPLSLLRCLMPASPAAQRECQAASAAHHGRTAPPLARVPGAPAAPAGSPVPAPASHPAGASAVASAGNAATSHSMRALGDKPVAIMDPLLLAGQNQTGNAAVARAVTQTVSVLPPITAPKPKPVPAP